MNTLENYITEYLEYCEYRKHLNVKSLKAYKIDLKQYDTFSCDLPEYLSRNTLDSFLTNLHKQYKPKTVKRKIASLKAFFHYLEYKDLLEENPFNKLDVHFREAKLLPKTIPLEINYETKHIDIAKSEQLIEKVHPKVIFVDRSEGTIYEDFSWLSKYKDIYKIFDASQYLTNIIANDYISPFDMGFDAILSTTHKNFPGPQRALYCTKQKDSMWEKLFSKIGTYVSNMHSYSIYSLGMMLENLENYKALSHNMLVNTEQLKRELLSHQLMVYEQQALSVNEAITHHIWIQCSDKTNAFELYKHWEQYGFLTNYRLLPYHLGYGIRMGLSAATVSGLLPTDIPELANLLAQIYHSTEYSERLKHLSEEFIIKIKERNHA